MKILLVLAFWLFYLNVNAQVDNWIWMKGDTLFNHTGVYGIQGTPNSLNKPVSRISSITWTDLEGNLWLFGGNTFGSYTDLYLNDLWKYNLTTNQWTWVKGDTVSNQLGIYGTKGQSSYNNKPGARMSSISWVDASGNFWLYGGYGYSVTNSRWWLNDLWKYSVATNEWTWVKGDSAFIQNGIYGIQGVEDVLNKPGAREHAVSWSDKNGNLWLFGGYGFAEADSYAQLNDLWKFNPATTNWTWFKGDKIGSQYGVYGVQGVSASSNKPGSRLESIGWTDADNNLWLFGGSGYGVSGVGGNMNDLWKYSIAINEWVWIKGDNVLYPQGVYGVKGVSSINNNPGGRSRAVSWKDKNGNFWLFGGEGHASTNKRGWLNDLWRYSPSTNEWTWINGDNLVDQYGIYRTQGVAPLFNRPGSRNNHINWLDKDDNFWIFGGTGYSSLGAGYLNDLWKFSNNSLVTSNNDLIDNVVFKIYPNPILKGNEFNLQMANQPIGKYYLSIYDILGVQIFRKPLNYNGNSTLLYFRISDQFNPGIYIAQLENERGHVSHLKIMIQ